MHRIRTWANQKAHGPEPLVASNRRAGSRVHSTHNLQPVTSTRSQENTAADAAATNDANNANNANNANPVTSTSTAESQDEKTARVKPGVFARFIIVVRDILFSSFVNVLLVFVPVGIAAHFTDMSAGIVFAMNAIAIIPLAGLLSFATESVAKRLGDTIGALMNVTFGNAVELIIFIALVKNEIRVVQASLVGSILANLLLILGMCFLLGGLRYREQIYNSTVTQMSACLLSLSVSSLLLPTAFHASFSDTTNADKKVLQVSRGTSVILLLVYLLYLVFQLNSHAYMYESTPLEVIERESVPGPAAGYFNSSSSSSESSSSDSDTGSDRSNGTARRIKRAIKRGRNKIHHRASSSDENTATPSTPTTSAPSGAATAEPSTAETTEKTTLPTADQDAADDESEEPEAKPRHKRKHKHKKHHKKTTSTDAAAAGSSADAPGNEGQVRRVDFALASEIEAQTEVRPKPFSLRTLANPSALSKTLSVNVFNTHLQNDDSMQSGPSNASPANMAIPQPQLRRTASLPVDDRRHIAAHGSFPPIMPIVVNRTPRTVVAGEDGEEEEEISRTSAIILLLVSTGLVALCAEFMVDSIDAVVSGQSGISEAFIGLVLLPIVGNAAEHVTGVTVAMKNKMDLALGVALGSSIQIALFVTPIVVILGWIMNKEMSLYFTLFETVSMFVSAFIVNFLVLDGRSNYLEGALLCAAYVIIAVASFFYPDSDAANSLGGGTA